MVFVAGGGGAGGRGLTAVFLASLRLLGAPAPLCVLTSRAMPLPPFTLWNLSLQHVYFCVPDILLFWPEDLPQRGLIRIKNPFRLPL